MLFKTVLRFWLLLQFAPLLVGQASTDSSAEVSKLLALENAWNLAQLHHDAKALQELIPETYVYTDYDGTVMNKAQFLADLQDKSYRATLMQNENVRVFPYGSTAVIVGTYRTKGIYKGKLFDHRGRFTDTWVFKNSKWMCVATHTNLIQASAR
jgi:hypothetical protein